jgi:hypothetical protein
MGAKIILEPISLSSNEAEQFAQWLDPLPAHLNGNSNLLLPSGTVSGFYVILKANSLLIQHKSYESLLCGYAMRIRWARPVLASQSLRVEVEFTDQRHLLRNNTPVVKRTSRVEIFQGNESGKPSVAYEINHLLEPDLNLNDD